MAETLHRPPIQHHGMRPDQVPDWQEPNKPTATFEPSQLPLDQARLLSAIKHFYAPVSTISMRDAMNRFTEDAVFDVPTGYFVGRDQMQAFMLCGKALLAMHFQPEFVKLDAIENPRIMEVIGRMNIMPRFLYDGPLSGLRPLLRFLELPLWVEHTVELRWRVKTLKARAMNLPVLPNIWRYPFGWFMGHLSSATVRLLPVEKWLDEKAAHALQGQ